MGTRTLLAAAGATLALSVATPATAAARPVTGSQGVVISVLSTRADLVSNGEALIDVTVPPANAESPLRLSVDGRDITAQLTLRSGAHHQGLITGLALGDNHLRAALSDGSGATLTITNHPNGGPIFAGPQMQPWSCQPGAIDAQCDQAPTFTYLYQSTDSTKPGFHPYDPANPATDVASTTTDQGVTVPFIVRVETGYQDRDQYSVATLFQPGQSWSALAPQRQFNHKLLITHGASCDLSYATGGAPSTTRYAPSDVAGTGPSALDPQDDGAYHALASGYVVMSTALDNNGHDCDVVVQAESLLMAKEHVVNRYGTLRYTIGTGCSGGSLAQQWIANAYPGIYQGILPTCSFPDTWTSATQVMDYHLLRAYFETPSAWGTGVAWTPSQWAAVEGNQLPVDAVVSDIGFFSAIVPTHACSGLPAQKRYDPVTNPGGARCSIADMAVNVFGQRPSSVWSPVEQKLGHGFAGVPVDNVGVQYGLSALQSAQITPAQFVDLNATIGGLDIDINPSKARIAADQPALANAYRSGMINETNNLDQTAIIDCRGPDPGAAHDSYRAFAVRARLDREHGNHDNQLIWEGPTAIIGDTTCNVTSLQAMDRWLAAVEGDTSTASQAVKIARDKPADLQDQCWNGAGVKLTDGLCPPGVVPVYGTPRTVAGDAITTDANKCRLQPLNRSDYLLPFTDAQWATLQATFPGGVCDYSKPAVARQKTVPWLTYQDAGGRVVYGGTPLGPPPHSLPVGRGGVRPVGVPGGQGGWNGRGDWSAAVDGSDPFAEVRRAFLAALDAVAADYGT